tara:strand:+ start:917 stop:1045 length:129 start_codon:yes stop_codon:yes gene_type:complete
MASVVLRKSEYKNKWKKDKKQMKEERMVSYNGGLCLVCVGIF